MRKLPLLFAPATLALAVLAACEDDSDNMSGGFQLPDGSLADFYVPPSTIDATVPDAHVAPSVSVTVVGASSPRSGVPIVFHDAAGAVIATKVTGNDGKATLTDVTPAMVSALIESGPDRHVVTWVGVENGDDLQLRDGNMSDEVGMYSITAPTLNPPTFKYHLDTECSTRAELYGTAAELPIYGNCNRPRNPILATGFQSNGPITGHAFKKGAPPATDGGTVSVLLGEWRAPSTLDLTLKNAPEDHYFETEFLQVADGVGFETEIENSEGTNTTYLTATGFADAYQATAVFRKGTSEVGLIKRFAPGPNVELDYAQVLPAITDEETDVTNPRRPIVSWAFPATESDGGLVKIRFSNNDERAYDWTFVVPPGTTNITAPDMPAEADYFLPHAADAGFETDFYSTEILFIEAEALTSYAMLRQNQGTVFPLSQKYRYLRMPVMPVDGTYRTSLFRQQEL